jgi:hypothetical protein
MIHLILNLRVVKKTPLWNGNQVKILSMRCKYLCFKGSSSVGGPKVYVLQRLFHSINDTIRKYCLRDHLLAEVTAVHELTEEGYGLVLMIGKLCHFPFEKCKPSVDII